MTYSLTCKKKAKRAGPGITWTGPFEEDHVLEAEKTEVKSSGIHPQAIWTDPTPHKEVYEELYLISFDLTIAKVEEVREKIIRVIPDIGWLAWQAGLAFQCLDPSLSFVVHPISQTFGLWPLKLTCSHSVQPILRCVTRV